MDFSFRSLKEIPSTIAYHYKEGNIWWLMAFYMTSVHILGIVGLTRIHLCKPETLLWAYALWPISGFGIVVGAHRLWSHRSFEASLPLRIFLMLCNCIANQRSLWIWCRDHRVHHKFSETEADPHNASRGFFYAHMGWLYLHPTPEMIKAGREIDMQDLLKDPVIMFQKRTDPILPVYLSFIMPAQVAHYFWGEDIWNAFFVACMLRYCYVLHITWLVNSAAHLYGDHPYDTTSYPAENPIVSFFAGGEGWHNYHHKYPYDYATSEFGTMTQFNFGKVSIDIFCALGLAWGCKRATPAWELARERRDRDAAKGIPLPKREQRPWEAQEEEKKTD